MKKKLLIGIIATLTVLALTAVAFSQQGWRMQNWDKEKVITLEGKITDADRPIVTMDSNGKEYIVHLGPIGYWQDKGVKIEKDTPIKITGMVVENDGKMNIYPQTVTIEGKELKLADESGVPAWAGNGHHGQGRNGWQGRGNRMGFGGGNQACPYYGQQ